MRAGKIVRQRRAISDFGNFAKQRSKLVISGFLSDKVKSGLMNERDVRVKAFAKGNLTVQRNICFYQILTYDSVNFPRNTVFVLSF